jgi:molybdopterin-synthase adenylyltransferase
MSAEAQPASGRYSRQLLLPQIGRDGQERLRAARVLVLGVGALGGHLAAAMVRAGVGRVRLADRDFIEENNLQRQSLYDETDIAEGLPKAVAAARKLARANTDVAVEPVVCDVTARTIMGLLDGCSLVLDGADNFELRLLLNDACLKHRIPWVYGAAVATYGMTMPILPGDGPCLRCLVPAVPAPGTIPTCDTAGVLGTVPQLIAALQATEGLKILMGRTAELVRGLRHFDLWTGEMDCFAVSKAAEPCPACDRGVYEFLEGGGETVSARLCGRSSVQVSPAAGSALDFPVLARRLAALGTVTYNPHMLRFSAGARGIVLFPDGRAIVTGTTDPAEARSLYARYIGS